MRAFLMAVVVAIASTNQPQTRTLLGDRASTITRETQWTLVSSIPIRFRTFHPQGIVKIGETFIVSSVEVTVPTKRFPSPVDGLDRDAGEGIGHLFKMDGSGNLIAEARVGEKTVYHPGGIDYDGTSVWVPVAEYRPNSRSIIYRVDPQTMNASEVLRAGDHIGAVAFDTDDRTLHGVSWGSRRFYRWKLGRGTAETSPPQLNPSHYVDYQDCKYAGRHRMLCTGVTEMRINQDAAPFRLGGMDLIDLRDGRPLHQTPVLLWTSTGLDMTHNPVWIEPTAHGVRAFFMPEDDASSLYVYEGGGR
jgi:Family of unknown function (DUF6454)